MATKLLLVEDVFKLGRSGDIVSVKEGYARNFLLPRGLAMRATKATLKRQDSLQKAREEKAIEDKNDSQALSKRLDKVVVNAKVKVDPEGHMYGSVTVLDLVQLLQDQQGIELDKNYFLLKHPLKETGIHRVDLKLKEDVEASVTVKIMAEGMEKEAQAIEEAKEAEVAVVQEIKEESVEDKPKES